MGTKNDFGGTIARSYEESEDDPKNRGVGLFGLGSGRPITVGALRRLRPHDGGVALPCPGPQLISMAKSEVAKSA